MAGLYLYIELLAKSLGGPSDEVLNIADKLADQVGNASGGIGYMPAALKDSNAEIRLTPPGLLGGTHARAITTNHHQSLILHSNPPP